MFESSLLFGAVAKHHAAPALQPRPQSRRKLQRACSGYAPDKILTADLGLFKSLPRNAHNSSLARSSIAGACSRILSAPSMTPETSFFLARGWTLTANTTVPFSGYAFRSSNAIYSPEPAGTR